MINTQKLENTGRVIWITGMSGSGKTTLAIEIVKKLKEFKKVFSKLGFVHLY